jgi:hypothetical protein
MNNASTRERKVNWATVIDSQNFRALPDLKDSSVAEFSVHDGLEPWICPHVLLYIIAHSPIHQHASSSNLAVPSGTT